MSSAAPDLGTPAQRTGGTLVWLRPFDLRLADHAALAHACERAGPVHLLFIWSQAEDDAQGPWRLSGTAAALWLHHALGSLDQDLQRRYGVRIVYRYEDSTARALAAAAAECGATEVVTSRSYDLAGAAAETEAVQVLSSMGLRLQTFQTFLLYDIENVRVDMGNWRGHFGTLTPFHQACIARGEPRKPLPEPSRLQAPARPLRSAGLDALGLARMPVRADGSVLDWGAPICEAWDISEAAAQATLRDFLAPGGGFGKYEKARNLADHSAVARISPYLRFGMLSARAMYWDIKRAGGRQVSVTFWRRLIWRDLAYWQLRHFPDMQEKPVRAHYEGQTWSRDAAALERWQRGQTGYPLIDAGLRELWTTGWMAQNVRMAAAILLCEMLNITWVEGEKWFHHTLVDADPAINAMMWQNAGKAGLDQWNFTMDPRRAGFNQDPAATYTRKWCPELKELPTKYVHAPWDAPENVLRAAGVTLGPGGNYPERIVKDIHGAARVSGDAIREQRARMLEWNDKGGYDLITLPRGTTIANDGQRFRVFTKREYRISDGGDPWEGWEEQVNGGGKGAGKGGGTRGGNRGGKGGQRQNAPRFAAVAAAPERRWDKGNGRGGGQKPSAGASSTSHQSVLEEYMNKAVGG